MCAKSRMAVTIGGIRMKNPVMVASGTFGYGPEYAGLVDLNRLGAIVVKGLSVEPWEGNDVPRMVEVPGGLVNAIGLQNPGVDAFVAEYMPFLRNYDVAVIANVWGRTVAEYAEVVSRLDGVEGIDGIELNVSCPNIKQGGIAFGTDRRLLARVIAETRKRTRLPLIVKLSPNVPNISVFAAAAEGCGCDALSLINSIPAMVVDVETRTPALANVTGGLSGPAVHPVAVKLVWEASRAVKIPVIGIGGISTARDAIEFLLVGASAVAVGTSNFADPETPIRVIEGIETYLDRHGIRRVSDLIGAVKV